MVILTARNTAETKNRLLKSGDIREHTYYHCTRKTTKIKCDPRKHITVDDLELLIEKEIEKYTILPEFLQWALEGLNKKNDTEIEDKSKVYEMQHKTLTETQKELDELTKMRYRQLIDDETFIKEKNTLQGKITQLKENLRETESRAERWLELTEKTFSFATYARSAFITAKGKEGLEQPKMALNEARTEVLASIRTRWLPDVSAVRTLLGLLGKTQAGLFPRY